MYVPSHYAFLQSLFTSSVIYCIINLGETDSLGMLVANGPFHQPRLTCERNGVLTGIDIDCGNRITRRKPVQIQFDPPQIQRYLTWDWTRPAEVRIWRLTAWAMERPYSVISENILPNINPGQYSHSYKTSGRILIVYITRWHYNSKHFICHYYAILILSTGVSFAGVVLISVNWPDHTCNLEDKQYFPPKYWWLCTNLHTVTSHKSLN
jgi:hypothetical protein